MSAALVLGGSGFVGGHLAARLAARGDVLATSATGAPRALEGVRWTTWRVGEPQAKLLDACRPSLVVFGPALRSDTREYTPADRAAHVAAAGEAARLCAERGATIVFLSSGSVFDSGGGPNREDDPPRPSSEYARCKAESEALVLASGAAALVPRFCQVIGRDLRWPTRFERLVSALRAGQRVERFRYRVNLAEARDVCESIERLLDAGARGVWHLGSVDSESDADFARRVARAVGADPSLVGEAEDPFRDCTLDVAKARALLPARLFPDQDTLIARGLDSPALAR